MNIVKKKRLSLELTQQQLADCIGVSQYSIVAYEKYKSVPRKKVLQKMSNFLGCSPEEILRNIQGNYVVSNNRDISKHDFLAAVKKCSLDICKNLCSGFSWEEIEEKFRQTCIQHGHWKSDFENYLHDLDLYYAITKDLYFINNRLHEKTSSAKFFCRVGEEIA